MKKTILKNLHDALVCLAVCAVVGLIFGCPIKRIFGVPCPGCGMTRGCLALLRLDFREALRFHPLSPLIPVAFAAYVFKDALPLGGKLGTALVIAGAAAVLAVYVVRMVLYFPDIAPMDFDANSVFGKIVRFLLLH